MANTVLEIKKSLGGVEDLLLDATLPHTVDQLRAGHVVPVTKINWETLPVAGKYPDPGFKSLKEYLDELNEMKDHYFVGNNNGGIGIVIGDAGLTWDGGALNSNEIGIVQLLPNGKHRWIGKTTVGSDNWIWRGRVSGQDAVGANDFITKQQADAIDAKAAQADWNEANTHSWAYIKNKPTLPTNATTSKAGLVERATDAEAAAGTDTERYITPKQLKDYADAHSSNASGHALGKIRDSGASSSIGTHYRWRDPIWEDTTEGGFNKRASIGSNTPFIIDSEGEWGGSGHEVWFNSVKLTPYDTLHKFNAVPGDAISFGGSGYIYKHV